jgi:hypothetical protein
MQIIPVYYQHSDNDGVDYYIYEMNLVLDNGDRVSLVEQGNIEIVDSQVNVIASFLKIPIWRKPKHT